jgi:hypothetical protein
VEKVTGYWRRKQGTGAGNRGVEKVIVDWRR